MQYDYHDASNKGRTPVGNRIAYCRRCSNYIFILDLIPGFNGLDTDNCKTDNKHFKFGIWCVIY